MQDIIFSPAFHWFFSSSVAHDYDHEDADHHIENNLYNYYGNHCFYNNDMWEPALGNGQTPLAKIFKPVFDLTDKKSLIRIKCNWFPSTREVFEHTSHCDYEYPHIGALLSLNTCDGFTKVADGTKIESVENRLLIFEPHKEHCSTTTTNEVGRYNINFNLF